MRWLFPSTSANYLVLMVSAALLQGGAANSSQDAAKVVLRGMVVDTIGAVIPHVTVEISVLAGSAGEKAEPLPVVKLEADPQGKFSAALPPGHYQVCAPLFPRSCREVVLENAVAPEDLVLKIAPWEEVHDETLPESRFQKIAGRGAQNCGRVKIKQDRRPATACALRLFQHRKPFYVIYDEMGIDAFIATGMAWNAMGEPYVVEYGSMGIGGYPLPPRDTAPDGSYTVLTPCSRPLRIFVNEEGELDCFKHKELLQQYMEWNNYRNVGDAGYKEFIPVLKKRLRDPEVLDDPDQQADRELALAKLGDRQQQQAIVCEFGRSGPKEKQDVAMEKVPYVGGWYVIRFYREMLAPVLDHSSSAAKKPLNDGDVMAARLALMAFEKVYNGPSTKVDAQTNPEQIRKYARQWLTWITEHQKELKQPPTGKGVDFSGKSCPK
jgi:hypothetical protein